MRRASFIVILLAACGSRTALDVPGSPSDDAGVVAREAGGGADACGAPGIVTLSTMTYTTSHTIVHEMAQDDQYVYWLDYGDHVTGSGTVRRAPKCGGETLTLASRLHYPGYIAVAGGEVFWDDLLEIPGHAVIVRQPVGGGEKVTIANDFNVFGIAADASSVYWINESAVVRAAHDGSHVVTLASMSGAPVDMTLQGENLYWSGVDDDAGAAIQETPTAGGATTTLATFEGVPYRIAVDDHGIYVSVSDGSGQGFLLSAPIGGGAVVTLTQADVVGLASDGVDVYWDNDDGDVGDGSVFAMPIGGGAVTTIASGETSANGGLLVDGVDLFWFNDGNLMRAPK